MSITRIIIIGSHIPVFAVALYALFIYTRLKIELKPFAWFLFCSGILQLVSLIFWFLEKNNLFILHFLVPLGFVFLVGFYRKILIDFLHPMVLIVTAASFVVFSVINSVFFQTPEVFNSNALTVECVLLLILSLSTYTLLLNKTVINRDQKAFAGINWINSGVFIYHASTLLIFYFGEYITSNIGLELSRYTWVVHSAFSVIMYFCFWKGLWNRATT
ncbi:MAG: hypothetical protein A3D31_13715 [Candidatus Fluviicola riflensis]|nr:MAG: hypothetical protein A3D31_13715 [Candidatus Fluviicola riflensis]OGS85099.1 MAG: hypothetical protein A2724_10650 [Fluviicola sp. RIFCSPHIGHO2_01_FULL_43_53]OGS89371.1 MAG: hypothetical protein A3E30_04955 [Fluviicola sp. RIFCSPHIGHO2_12_FULL_43_24]